MKINESFNELKEYKAIAEWDSWGNRDRIDLSQVYVSKNHILKLIIPGGKYKPFFVFKYIRLYVCIYFCINWYL